MKETICPFCSKSNRIVWASLFTFIIDWNNKVPKTILITYECQECKRKFDVDTHITYWHQMQEKGN